MMRPIAIGLSPNTTVWDVCLALRFLLTPWRYKKGGAIKALQNWFRKFFHVSYAIPFDSGRFALLYSLQSLGIKEGDEILLQAFTCVAVPNAVLWTGAKPVYVDILDSFTIDARDLEKKITPYSKAIIVQHTFGIPADMNLIGKIAKQHNLFVIEDCAHTIGGEFHGKKLGNFSDVSIFSFGRDKAVSCIFGGMALTSNKKIGYALEQTEKSLSYPSLMWIFQQLLHPVAFFIILPFYGVGIGKIILFFLQKLHLLSIPVARGEKQGERPHTLGKKMPNALAELALFQLKRVLQFNARRKKIASEYVQKLNVLRAGTWYKNIVPFLRFPLVVEKREEMLNFFRSKKIYVGKWYSEVVDPKGADLKQVFYKTGSCPNAEYIAKHILNLPTYPTMTDLDVKNVINVFQTYDQDHRN